MVSLYCGGCCVDDGIGVLIGVLKESFCLEGNDDVNGFFNKGGILILSLNVIEGNDNGGWLVVFIFILECCCCCRCLSIYHYHF